VTELVLRRLLPQARSGLDALGVDAAVADRLLGVIEARCLAHTNGADWQVRATQARESTGMERAEALRSMLGSYIENMHTNEPVHTWSV